jgi:glyoxylase-like metal-dependent hydrolase (beta-lactamase superfamily II)
MTLGLRRDEAGDRFRVYAIRYASRDGVRAQHFHHWTSQYAEPHPTAYYIWLLRSADRTILVDTGMSRRRADAVTQIAYEGTPAELLGRLGVAPDEVDTVILSHLHYDHAGTTADFPRATIHVQRTELDYWEGPVAARNHLESWLSDPEDREVIRSTASERVVLGTGDVEVAPGVSAHLVGGHTPGMQVVRVQTAEGVVVIASDASHYYENIEEDRPFAILHDVPGTYAAFDRIAELAGQSPIIVPGHDPLVLERHPRLPDSAIDVAVIA